MSQFLSLNIYKQKATDVSLFLVRALLNNTIHKLASLKCEKISAIKNKGDVVSFHPTTESNLRTALGVEICKLCIIARIWKPLPRKFSDLCREMDICSDVM